MIRMLKILVIVMLSNLAVNAQIYTKPNNSYGVTWNRLRADSSLLFATYCGQPVGVMGLHSIDQHMSALYFDSCGHKLYWFDPSDSSWTKSGATQLTDSSLVVGRDTITIRPQVQWCNITQLGADPTGVTDVSNYVNELINAGCRYIYLPKGKYLITSTIQLRDSVTIKGDGRNNTIIKLSSNIAAFKSSPSGGYHCQFLDFSFEGNKGTGTTDQIGILIDSTYGSYINNIGGYMMAGFTIRIKNNGYCCDAYTSTGVRGNIISNCYMQNCYGGVALDTLAEYNTVDNSTFVLGTYGIFNAGGNSRINSNNCSSNTYGIYITGGSNNGHGIAAGNTFNHNNSDIYCTGVTLGFSFVGNMVYAGSNQVTLIDCDNINFNGGDIAAGIITITNCTSTTFNDVRITSPTWTITGAAPTIVRNGKVNNGISVIDAVNGNQLDITHTNKQANFTVGSGGRFDFSDTVKVKRILGGTADGDSLSLIPTTSATSITTPTSGSYGKIKIGNDIAFQFYGFPENGGFSGLGIGTNYPDFRSDLHLKRTRPGNLDLQVQNESSSGSATTRILFKNHLSHIMQLFMGSATQPFAPDGVLMHVNGTGGIRFAADLGDIVFNQSSVAGVGEYFRLKLGTGSFLFGTTADDAANGRFKIKSRATIDSLLRLLNVTAPPSNYNVMVHSLTDSGTYQVPASKIPNFANTDLNFTGSRSHNAKGFALNIDSLSALTIFGRGSFFGVAPTRTTLTMNPSSQQMLLSNAIRKTDNSADSGGATIQFVNYDALQISAGYGVAGRNAKIYFNGVSASIPNAKGSMIITADSIGMTPAISTNRGDTILVAGEYDASTASNEIYKVAVNDALGNYRWSQIANSTPVNNTTTETTILGSGTGSLIIPPAAWATGKSFTVKIQGTLSVDASNPGTTTFRTKLGSVTLAATSGIFHTAGTSDRHFEIDLIFTCRTTGATGTVFAQGWYRDQNASINLVGNSNSTSTIDMTVNQTLDATLQWSQAATGNTCTTFITLFKNEN